MTARIGTVGLLGTLIGMGAAITWVRAGDVGSWAAPTPALASGAGEEGRLAEAQPSQVLSQGFAASPGAMGGPGGTACDPCLWNYRYVQLSDPNNRIICAAPGVLHGIIMTPCSCSWPRLYDSASGNLAGKPAICDLPLQLPAGTTAQIFIPFDIAFNEGLYISGGNAGTITVIYRPM